MESSEDPDLKKMKELMHRSGEFIAYFELAENKMVEWRQNLEQQAATQQNQFQHQLHALQTELDSLQEILTQAGLARFRIAAENMLNQGKEYVEAMQKAEQQLLKQVANNQRELSKLTENAVTQIAQETTKAIAHIDMHLAEYDVKHFRRIANESCEQVEQSALNTISKSEKFLRLFQWRSVTVALLTTLVSAFIIGLYISNEYPWETHMHATNERNAGKILINVWPKLTDQEKAKILSGQSTSPN